MALRQSQYNPAVQNSPLNLYNHSAAGIPYAQNFANVQQDILLAPDIDPDLTPSFPEMFKDVAWLMSRTRRDVTALAYNRVEEPWIHVPIVVRAGAAGAVASPGAQVTATVNIADGSYDYVSVGDKLSYGGTNVIVTAKSAYATGASTLTVGSLHGVPIPATTTNEEITNHGPWGADGFSTVYSTTIPEQIVYSNVLEYGRAFATRFDRIQKKSLQFNSKVDLVERSIQQASLRALTTMQARAFMSKYGRTTLPDGQSITTSTSGIFEQQDLAGVTEQVVSSNQAIDALREIMFDTALQSSSRKVLLGTKRSLHAVGWAQKGDKIRYQVGNHEWDMNMYSYDFNGHEATAIYMDQWNDRGLYPKELANTILVLNEDDVILNHFRTEPILSRKYTLLSQQDDPGSLNNFDLVWYEFLFGIELKRAWATGRLRLV